MSKHLPHSVQLLLDLVVLSAAYWLAFLLRFKLSIDEQQTKQLFFTWPYVVLLQYVVLAFAGISHHTGRYSGLRYVKRIVLGVGLPVALLVALRLGLVSFGGHFRYVRISLGILALDFALAVLGILALDFALAVLRGRPGQVRPRPSQPPLLLGARRAVSAVAGKISLRRAAQLCVDIFVLSAAYWLAFLIRLNLIADFDLSAELLRDKQLFFIKQLFFTWPYVVILQYVGLALLAVPDLTWRYIGIRDVGRIVLGIGSAIALLVALRFGLVSLQGPAWYLRIPLGIQAIDFLLALLGIAGVRVLRRMLFERHERRRRAKPGLSLTTLLIGAGRAGSVVASEIAQRPDIGMKLVGFADDDPAKLGTIIQGAKVLGDTRAIAQLVEKHSVEQAIICLEEASSEDLRRIVAACAAVPIPVKIISGEHKLDPSRIREVTIEDLLRRSPVQLDQQALRGFLAGKRVLITGAGGSIGSELCRQVVQLAPQELVLAERSESALFEIHQKLIRKWPEARVIPRIVDICDLERLLAVFSRHRPQVVFNAAAHKHVPMMELNPGEAVKNNVFGTQNVADAAHRYGAAAFVLISTDKAVNPSSIMGATKRAQEIYVQSLSQHSETKFVAVRFGNVLNSAGSVVPTFKKQIARGGPVTVTHPDMRRYFMTIQEACQLVMQAAAMGEGGEIFALDMGEPVRIHDLARDLIHLSGLTEKEISIAFSGIRPGEKLFEELSMDAEHMTKTIHPKIFIGKIEAQDRAEVTRALEKLKAATGWDSAEEVRAALRELVPELHEPELDEPEPSIPGSL